MSRIEVSERSGAARDAKLDETLDAFDAVSFRAQRGRARRQTYAKMMVQASAFVSERSGAARDAKRGGGVALIMREAATMSFRAQRGRARRQTDTMDGEDMKQVSERSGAARDAKQANKTLGSPRPVSERSGAARDAKRTLISKEPTA